MHGFQLRGEYAPYYKNSLLYLACVDIEKELNQEQRIQRAHDLCISGFMADSIYNFGELVRGVYPLTKHKNLYYAYIC
jgi:26S proteasome regulatory subunit N9